MEKIVAIKVIEKSSESHEHSTCNESELNSKIEGLLKFIFFGWMILMHDEKGDEDDGVYSEMHPKSKDGIWYILFNEAWLSLSVAFLDSFNGTHVSMYISPEIEIPESCS